MLSKRVKFITLITLTFSLSLGLRLISYSDENITETAVKESTDKNDAYNEGKYSISLNYGFMDTLTRADNAPLDITIENNATMDIKAKLSIEVSSGANKLRYIYDENISADKPTKIKEKISMAGINNTLSAVLYDEAGNVLCSAETVCSINKKDKRILIGVLSDKFEKLDYFNNLNIGGTEVKTKEVPLSPMELPDSKQAYDQLDMLIISGLNYKKLSREDADIILEWVDDGGLLLLGSGKNRNILTLFEDGIDELNIDGPANKDINMGIKYTEGDPDEDIINLDVCDIFTAGGLKVMQSGDTAMLTKIGYGKGLIGLCAYDLCDIRDFCLEKAAYTDDLIISFLGRSRIESFDRGESDTDIYANIHEALNSLNIDRLPGPIFYIALALVYLSAMVLIYGYLRQKNMQIYNYAFLPILSGLVILIIILSFNFSREGDISTNSLLISEIEGNTSKEELLVNVLTDAGSPYELQCRENVSLDPFVSTADNNESLDMTIEKGESDTSIKVDKGGSFGENLYRLNMSENNEGRALSGVDVSILLKSGHIKGTIANNTNETIEDALIISHGLSVNIGTALAGETIELEDKEYINTPIGRPMELSAYLLNKAAYKTGSKEYLKAYKKEKLLKYYLSENLNGYFDGTYLIYFIENDIINPDILSIDNKELKGLHLVALKLDNESIRKEPEFISGLSREPKLLQGTYDYLTNEADGLLILEYDFGNRLNLQGMKFGTLNSYFENENLRAFKGVMSIYNYETGTYDDITIDKSTINAPALKSYLSPAGTIMIKYISDGESSHGRDYIPIPYVYGVGA